jgi:hypothetical protein
MLNGNQMFVASFANQHVAFGQQKMVESEAMRAARFRLVMAAQRYRKLKPISNEYYGGGYGEEVVADVVCSGALDGLVTRNHYGCLVLNAAHALFIDVDVLTSSETDRTVSSACNWDEQWQTVFDDLRTVLASDSEESFRIYRTAAGFRILATGNEHNPASAHATELMETAGADCDFVALCRIQNSFRARLTPKPWRCGLGRPPSLFPRHTSNEVTRFAEWLSQYDLACASRATCRYLGRIGPERIHPRIASIVELHDRQTRALERLSLA